MMKHGGVQRRWMRSCLIVDDSATIRHVLVDHIRGARKGIADIYEAADPTAAMQMFRDKEPDVVFLDMMMAGDDPKNPDGKDAAGLGVLKSMLAEKPDIPIVIVTGMSGSQPELVEAISLGAAAALRKPVSGDDIRRVLDHLAPDKERMDYFG